MTSVDVRWEKNNLFILGSKAFVVGFVSQMVNFLDGEKDFRLSLKITQSN